MKKLLSCVLVFLMIFGTCTTTFAALLTDTEIAYVEDIVENAKAKINEIIDIAENVTDAEKEAMVNDAIAAAKAALIERGVSEETINDVEEIIKDEAAQIVTIVETKDDAAAKDKIDAYIAFLKEALNVTTEDEAKIAEIVAEVTALVDEIKDLSADDVKAAVDSYIADLKAQAALEYAKLGHKHYEAAEGDLYVAIGANTAGLDTENEEAYFALVADNYGIDVSVDAADLADADLITFQVDAADVIFDALEAEVNWSKYFTAEQLAVVETVWAAAAEIAAMDWEAVGELHYDGLAAYLKDVVLANLPAEITVDEEKIDNAIAFVATYLENALAFAEEKKDAVVETIAGLDAVVVEFAEKFAYAVVSYAVDTKAAIEEIQAINPEATLVVLGMYNNFAGVEVELDGTTIDAGEYFAYAVEATNLYYNVLAAANGGFAFVNIADASVAGAGIEEANVTADADGHAYIKDQIVAALTCTYGAYEKVDKVNHAKECLICGYEVIDEHDLSYAKYNATYHTVKCSICDYEEKEKHDFSGKTCELCGYVKSNGGASGGGGVVSNQFTIKFETNGGSAVASVTVKKDELLAEPTAPTKEGFVFDGWYTDKALTAKYDFSTPVKKSFTLYAKWAQVSAVDKFADLDKAAWYYDYVKAIVEEGLMNGVSETSFAPNATLTRGMFVTILHRVEGEPAAENAVAFTDVAEGQWYTNAVKWANANGIVNGISETEFAPDAEVTREQMAAMIARYVDYKEIEVAAEGDVTYTDSAEISEYAKDAVKTANKLGILIGNADGSFAPKKNATRAEAAALFVRLLDVLAK